MNEFFSSPLFGIVLCIFSFGLGTWINKKVKSPLANPLVIAIALVIIILEVFHIPLESFQEGGEVVSMFLAPATVALALSVYRQFEILKKNFLPVVLGCLAGCLTSMTSIILLGKAFGLDEKLIVTMVPKSVTTPFAMEISEQLGGLVPITVASVIFTGIFGALLSPFLIKLFHIEDPVAQGVAMGTSCHAIGTSKALEFGEVQGAMSGISLSISGIITVLLCLLFQPV